ncbi:unnamed protein product, partial [Brachionus calyciflorus]
ALNILTQSEDYDSDQDLLIEIDNDDYDYVNDRRNNESEDTDHESEDENMIEGEKIDVSKAEAIRQKVNLDLNRNELLKFIAVFFCRGIYCQGVPVRKMWSVDYVLPIVEKLMSRNQFSRIIRCIRFDDKTTRSQRREKDSFTPVHSDSGCYKKWPQLT